MKLIASQFKIKQKKQKKRERKMKKMTVTDSKKLNLHVILASLQ